MTFRDTRLRSKPTYVCILSPKPALEIRSTTLPDLRRVGEGRIRHCGLCRPISALMPVPRFPQVTGLRTPLTRPFLGRRDTNVTREIGPRGTDGEGKSPDGARIGGSLGARSATLRSDPRGHGRAVPGSRLADRQHPRMLEGAGCGQALDSSTPPAPAAREDLICLRLFMRSALTFGHCLGRRPRDGTGANHGWPDLGRRTV